MAWKAQDLFPISMGFPIYCAAWVEKEDGEAGGGNDGEWVMLLGGGGGDGQRGISNTLELWKFNPKSRCASQVYKWTGDVPYRIVVHPKGHVAFCSFSNSCRWFGINNGPTPSVERQSVIEDAGLQTALACGICDGRTLLATGGEDGHLRLFDWSNEGCNSTFDIPDAHTSVKHLIFSCNGKLLASLGSSGSCRVWRIVSAVDVRSITEIRRENNEVFGFCKFSRITDDMVVLYLTSDQGQKRSIVSWKYSLQNNRQEEPVPKQTICVDRVSAFDVSADGKLLAVGTIEGDVIVLQASNMSSLTIVKRAHFGLVTALAFNNSRGLLSASVDARVGVTLTKKNIINGVTTLLAFIILLLAILVRCYQPEKRFGIPIFPSLRFAGFDFSFGQTVWATRDYEHAAT